MKTRPLTEMPAADSAEPSFLQGLEAFWLKPADPTLLALIRICTGCVMVYVYLTYSIGLIGFVGPDAWVGKNAADYMTHRFQVFAPPTSWGDAQWTQLEPGWYLASIYFHVTNPTWLWIIHLSILAVMILFTAGYQTRLTSVLAWLGALCYIQRSLPTLFGMDTMTNLLLMYLCIGSSGAALSVDRWLLVRRLRRRGVLHIDPPTPTASTRFALRMIQIHFCVIYMASGTAKLQGSSWWNGTALWGCFANFTFAPMSSPWYMEMLNLLSQNRLLWELVMSGGALFTLTMEIGFPFLVWTRLRWLCIIGSILLHLGIGLSMGLASFSMMMYCMVIAFVPPELIRPWLASFRRQRGAALPARVSTPVVAKAPAYAVGG